MLHKDYDRKDSAEEEKNSGCVSQAAWRQDEPIGNKPRS
jgi:hypothetical protein